MPACGLPDRQSWPNSCSLTVYARDSTEWHADDQLLFSGNELDSRCSSLWLWLGETRTLDLRLKERDQGPLDGQIELVGGDICTMEGFVQHHFLHRVPRARTESISVGLVWRWIVSHDPEHCVCEL